MKNPVRQCLIISIFLFMSSAALAEPVKWYLQDVAMADGGYAFGSFVFDADTEQYSEIDINTTTGTLIEGAQYGDPNPDSPGNSVILITLEDATATPLTGQAVLVVTFSVALTNGGGTVNIDVAGFTLEGECVLDSGGRECGSIGGPRTLVSGFVTTIMPGPVKWYLQGVTLSDGGRAIGSFVYDADAGEFSEIDIVTTTGSSVVGAMYGDPNPGSPGNSMLISLVEDASAATLVGQRGLGFPFTDALRDVGGIVSVDATTGFNNEGECLEDSTGRECGLLTLERSVTGGQVTSVPLGVNMTAGLNGAWFNPDTSGQGVLLDIYPDLPLVFLAWFTYDLAGAGNGTTSAVGDPGQRWLTAQGVFRGNEAVLDVVLTTGGVFDSSAAVTNSAANSHGRIVLTFNKDCRTATMSYELFDQALSGVFPLQRLVDSNVALCLAITDAQ